MTYVGDLRANVYIEKSKATSFQYLFDQNSICKESARHSRQNDVNKSH